MNYIIYKMITIILLYNYYHITCNDNCIIVKHLYNIGLQSKLNLICI